MSANEQGTHQEKLQNLFTRLKELQREIAELQTSGEPESVDDYAFETLDGKRSLSECFNGHETLLVIHNMGSDCIYCTLWADGFNGLSEHLRNAVGFVVSSPETPAQQLEFATSRGWKFDMVSTANSSFAADLGYELDGGGLMPGVSVFKKNSRGDVVRVSNTFFGPGDPFCSIFHFWDLIPGKFDWSPEYSY